MTNEELFDILRPIILSVTGVPECILSNPNQPSPTGEYAAVQPQQSIGQRGQANIIQTTGTTSIDQNYDVRAQIICRAWVNFYRGDTRSYAQRLMQCNKRPDVSAALFKAKLGWMGTSQVNNLTALQSENWESRAQIELMLAYEVSSLEEINTIERASYEVQQLGDDQWDTVATGTIASPDAP